MRWCLSPSRKARRKKRVLLLLEDNFYPFDTRARQEARTLLEAGYEVSVVCPRGKGERFYERLDGATVYRFPPAPTPVGFWGYIGEYLYSTAAILLLSLVAFLRKPFHFVHAHNPPDTLFLIGAFYRLLGRKFIFDHHDLVPELYLSRFGKEGLVYRLLLLLERLSCTLADRILTVNQTCKELEVKRDGVPPDKVYVVRNGPDLAQIEAITPPQVHTRMSNKNAIVYVGILGPQDGVDFLLRSLHHLCHGLGRRDFHCWIIGDGAVLPELKESARELEIADCISFTGRLAYKDVMQHLAIADICVDSAPANPLNDKTCPVKVMEYMALGKPIVAYDLPECRRSVQGAALYAVTNDEIDFARQILHLMDNADLRMTMGAMGKDIVERELSWKHSAAVLLKAYENLQKDLQADERASGTNTSFRT